MTETDMANYDKYKNYIKRLTAYSGLWPDFEKQTFAMGLFLTIQATLTGFAMLCFLLYSCYIDSKNIDVFTKYIGSIVGYLTIIIKIVILGLQQKDLKRLNDGISARFEANLKVPENRRHLLAHLPTFSRFFYVYVVSIASSLISAALIPLLFVRHGLYLRLHPIVLPFSCKPGGLLHWIVYLYELLCVWNMWTIATGTDNLFCLYCFQIVGELKLLSSRFRKLRSSSDYCKDVRDCIKSHVVLMEAFVKLQEVFGFLALWFAISCAVCLCTIVFRAVEVETLSTVKIYFLISHSFVKLFQAYLFTWCGNMIIVESEICVAAVYESQWSSSGDKRFMKDVLTIVSQRPMVFKANKILELRMELFMKILNTSVSYFFLLQTLDDKA